VKRATFEAVIESSITFCDGQPLCLEEIEVDGEVFIGLGTKCETRFRWTNEAYLTLTDEEHYSDSRRNLAERTRVPEETQRWVISGPSGCWKQLHSFDGPTYADGDRLAVDSECATSFDSEFWAITSPQWENETRHDLDQPFSIVESHPNMTRRRAYYANTTHLYQDPVERKNCTCVPDGDPLAALMVTQAHSHLYTPDDPENAYFHERDHCDGHVLHVRLLPPSPPPPDDDHLLPPSPPYIKTEILATTGALGTSIVFFICCCTMCAWVGLGGRNRGAGRGKWFGVAEMRINRPAIFANEDPCVRNGARADISARYVAFATVPLLENRV